jgi:hypothetical protein
LKCATRSRRLVPPISLQRNNPGEVQCAPIGWGMA